MISLDEIRRHFLTLKRKHVKIGTGHKAMLGRLLDEIDALEAAKADSFALTAELADYQRMLDECGRQRERDVAQMLRLQAEIAGHAALCLEAHATHTRARQDLEDQATRLRAEMEQLKAVRACTHCGRDTVSGDCYGCEVDRLHTEVERLKGEIDTYDDIVKDLRAEVERLRANPFLTSDAWNEARAELLAPFRAAAEAARNVRDFVASMRGEKHYTVVALDAALAHPGVGDGIKEESHEAGNGGS